MPTMPNCVGLEYEAALLAMVNAGVRVLPLGYFQDDPVSIIWEPSSESIDTVISQIPVASSVIPKNAGIGLTISISPLSVATGQIQDFGYLPYADYGEADKMVVII